MLFAPIAFTRNVSVTATVINLSPNAANVPGYKFWGLIGDNTSNAAIAYVQIFNKKAANVTLGSTVADMVVPIQANGTVNFLDGPPFIFNIGLSAAVTTTKSGAIALGLGVDVTAFYEEQ